MLQLVSLLAMLTVCQPPQFQRHEIGEFRNGYQAAVADINGDGRLDVIALSIDGNEVAWYENPGWTKHPIAETVLNIDLAPHDIDGDGRPELVIASGFYFNEPTRGGQLQWFRRQTDFSRPWQAYPIAVDPVTHRVRWGDLDGDGRPELIHAAFFGPGSKGPQDPQPAHLWAFRLPNNPESEPWPVWKIDETLNLVHGIFVADLDGDDRAEILTASREGICRFDWEGSGTTAAWCKTHISPGAPPAGEDPAAPRGSSEVAAGRLGPNRQFLAAVEPWHGNQVAVYFPTDETGYWKRQVLDDSLNEGHGLTVADFNGDGLSEIVAGWRGKGGGLVMFVYDPVAERFNRVVLDPAMPCDCVLAADINADDRLDLVVNAGRANKVVWYENTTQ